MRKMRFACYFNCLFDCWFHRTISWQFLSYWLCVLAYLTISTAAAYQNYASCSIYEGVSLLHLHLQMFIYTLIIYCNGLAATFYSNLAAQAFYYCSNSVASNYFGLRAYDYMDAISTSHCTWLFWNVLVYLDIMISYKYERHLVLGWQWGLNGHEDFHTDHFALSTFFYVLVDLHSLGFYRDGFHLDFRSSSILWCRSSGPGARGRREQ